MKSTLTIKGHLYSLETPKVMGILNVTSDSFYPPSRVCNVNEIRTRVRNLIEDGADIIDIGGCSTRPGSRSVSEEEEYSRLVPALELVRTEYPEIPVSVDTFRSGIARKCIEKWGVDIINDIGGGKLDPEMWAVISDLGSAYVLMHMRGTPETMQSKTFYEDVTADVIKELAYNVAELRSLGVADLIIDPGFGFAKTIAQNYIMLKELRRFEVLDCPLLAGVSRKRMITDTLGVSAEESLNGTTVVNTIALLNGASILRVHDVLQAKEAVKIVKRLQS